MARIMIVDDEPDIREIVRLYLESAGHTVIPAKNGLECLKLVKKERPDLILMDIRMPKLDGWTTIKKLQELDFARDIPIVVLTVERLTPLRVVRKEIENLTAYVEKPFTKSKLMETVGKVLKRMGEVLTQSAKIEKSIEHGEPIARSYKETVRKRFLHEYLLSELERMKKEATNEQELTHIQNLIENEKIAVETLKLKERVMERMAETG